MSIEAIKEALKGIDEDECTSDAGWWETSSGAEFGAERLQAVLDIVQGLIERLEAAEKDAKRYAFLRNSVLVDGEIDDTIYVAVNSPDWKNKWALVGKDLDAAIDSAMAGGLAEGVSDGK